MRGGGLSGAVRHRRKDPLSWPKLHWSRFLQEAGRNDINQLALNATIPESSESPRAWESGWEERKSRGNSHKGTDGRTRPGGEDHGCFLGSSAPLPQRH